MKADGPPVRLCIPLYPRFQAGLLAQIPHKHGASGPGSSPPCPSPRSSSFIPRNREGMAQTAVRCQVCSFTSTLAQSGRETSPPCKVSATFFSPPLLCLHSKALPGHSLAATSPLLGCFSSSLLSLACAGLCQLQTDVDPCTSAPIPPRTVTGQNARQRFSSGTGYQQGNPRPTSNSFWEHVCRCWEERRCRCVPAALPGTHAPCPGGNSPQSPAAAQQALCLRSTAGAPASAQSLRGQTEGFSW